MCIVCWKSNRPDRPLDPKTRYTGGPVENCAWCGHVTVAGIYVRADPRELPFPAPEEDD
jgi:hypothetical protein